MYYRKPATSPPLHHPPTKASEKDAPSWCLQCHPVRDGGAGIFSLPMVISKHLICAVACPSRSDPRGRVLVAAASLLSVIFFCTSPWWWWWCWLLVGHVNMLHVNRHARADRRKATKNGLHFAPPNCRVILSVCVHVCVCVYVCLVQGKPVVIRLTAPRASDRLDGTRRNQTDDDD